MILVDHLISDNNDANPELAWTFIPDGDQEGFKWENGKWMHIDKVFNFKLQDGQAPVGEPLLDPKGNKNENKLQEKTIRIKPKRNLRIRSTTTTKLPPFFFPPALAIFMADGEIHDKHTATFRLFAGI